jgi:hypothetical protein
VPQIDNAAYVVGLSERVRIRVEEFGRVELRDAEAATLVRSKAVHVALVAGAVLAGVWSASKATVVLAFLAFWLGGVAEAVATPGAGAAEKAKGGVGKAMGAFVLGVVGIGILIVAIVFEILEREILKY